MSNLITRGGEFRANFRSAAALDTQTTLDSQMYISASGTVALVATTTSVPIGVGIETQPGFTVVNLNTPTKRAIAGGTVTAGGKLVQQTATAKLIDAAGTLTANPIVGIAVTGAAADGEKFEYIPLYYGSVVIA